MPPEYARVMLPLLGVIVSLSVLYVVSLLYPDGDGETRPQQRRDPELDHRLGAHRHTPAWGCRLCDEEKRR